MKSIILSFLVLFISIPGFADQPPPAKEVFILNATRINANQLALVWQIKPGNFLYQDKIQALASPNQPVHLGPFHFPKPLQKINAKGEAIPIYRHSLFLSVPILGAHQGEKRFDIRFQGCADDGFCYPPEIRTIILTFNAQHELSEAKVLEPQTDSLSPAEPISSQHDSLHQLFKSKNWAIIFLSFYGFGLLLAFTPCVLPMIPVLSGIILGQGKRLSTHKAFLLSLSYILSMATTYAIVGEIVALMGSNLQVALQSEWAIGMFSGIFILLALSMFGFYDLKLPAAWQMHLTKWSHSKAGGYYLGAAIMGCLSTLILSPCVTPPLIGVLGYIASSGDVTRGGLALFFLGLGIGTPLLLIGTSAGKWIPKTGHWMNIIKAFFGILLFAVAINLLSRILPGVYIMGLWASLLIFTGIYSGALSRTRSQNGKFTQGIGIMALVYGILILIGASQGNEDPLQPLSAHKLSSNTATAPYLTVRSVSEMQEILAAHKGKPIFIDFYADWCATCKTMEKTTLINPDVLKLLSQFIWIKADVTNINDGGKALLTAFQVIAPPTFIFINTQGEEMAELRLVGDITPLMLINALNQASHVDIRPTSLRA
jgi:thiol:disulfide interchange protein DsbD